MTDEKPRIPSIVFSKDIFGDTAFSSFLFDNKDIMNLDLNKRSDSNSGIRSPKLNAKPNQTQNPVQYQYPNSGKPTNIDINYSKETKSYPLSATVYNTNDTNYNMSNGSMSPSSKSYNAKYGMTTSSYHLSSPVSAPIENYSSYKQQQVNEHSETANYYNIINAIKRENINNINNTSKSLYNNNNNYSTTNSNNSSFTNTTPPLSPLPVNINNQKFYKGANQQSYSAVDLSRPDSYYEEIKGSKSVKEYSLNGPSPYSKPRSKSIHNINTNITPQAPTTYEEDSIDYLNDSMIDYSFTQKDYEGSVTTNGSEKDKKGHSRSISLSKSLKRAVSRNSKKSKKGHRKNQSTSEKSFKGYNDSITNSDSIKLSENGNPYQEFNEASLVFKPANGAISSYGEITNNDNNFDFDSMISSDQTRKISLTPNRMNEIQKHNTPINRLKPKNHERENFVPMTVINNTLGRGNNNKYNMDDFDYDSDDSIDRLLNEGKPKKKQETLWEFLKNSDPDDFIGNGKAKQVGKKVPQPVKSNSNGSQVKYIPIKIQYSPFDNESNNNNTNNNSNNNVQNLNNVQSQSVQYNKPINENVSQINAGLPIQQRSTSKNIKLQGVPTPPPHYKSQSSLSPNNIPHQSGMKLAQTISILAKTPELSPADEEPQTPLTPQAPQVQEKQYRTLEKPKPKMVSVGTQWYISDASLMRKKKVLFRPVDRRNPIAKYMFNHAFVETIYVTNESYKKKRNVPDIVPTDFLAKNFYYYSRNPSLIPTLPKVDVGVDPIEEFEEWVYPERDTNPIAKYIYLVKEGDYPWRDSNPIAKYLFNGYEKKESSSIVIINSGDIIVTNNNKNNENADKEIEIINDVLIETTSSCGSEKEVEESEMDKTVEVIKAYGDESDSLNNEDTEINDDITLSNNIIKKDIHNLYTQKEKDEIVNKLFNKIIFYLEDKEEKQKENSKTQEFAKLMFDENTKLRKELSKIRSELSAERVLRERAEEELDRYQSLMQSTLLK